MTKFHTFCRISYFSLILISFFGPFVRADDPVNLLLFYEDEKSVEYFEVAREYLKGKKGLYKSVIGEVYMKKIVDIKEDSDLVIAEVCKLVDEAFKGTGEKPHFILDFTRYGIPSESVKWVALKLNIPTISATFGQHGDVREWRELTPDQKGYLIQVSPPADMLVEIVRNIVDHTSMTSAVLLFNEDYEMYHKYKALLQNMPTRHLLTGIKKKNTEIRAQIDRLVHVDIVNFFLAATPDEISDVLTEASDPGSLDGPYFSDEYAWYSMSLEYEPVPHCKGCKMDTSLVHISPVLPGDELSAPGAQRLYYLRNRDPVLKLSNMFYFDLTLNAIDAVSSMILEENWPKLDDLPVCSSLIYDNSSHVITEERINLDLLSRFQKATSNETLFGSYYWEGNGRNFPDFKMKMTRYQFKKASEKPYTVETVGTWEAGIRENDNDTHGPLLNFEFGRNLSDHLAVTVFRIVTVVQPPFIYYNKSCKINETNKYSHCFYGYCIDLLTDIQNELKFNYTIRNVSEYGEMSPEPPHTWSGMIAELQNRKADIALGALSVMAERESVVDFTVPYYDLVGISILMKRLHTPTSLFKFLTVLEFDVWMTILISYFITSILMWFFNRLSPYSYRNNAAYYWEEDEVRDFNLKECLWFCMTSLTPQGGGEAPKNFSGRIVAAVWWFFGFIIIASYTANLAAFLTVSRLEVPLESLDDLSRQVKVQYAPLLNSPQMVYFERMSAIEAKFYEVWKNMAINDSYDDYEKAMQSVWEYPVSNKYTKMLDAIVHNNPPSTVEEAVRRVKGDVNKKHLINEFAFLGDASIVKYQHLISCDFKIVGEEFSRKPYALAVQQGSPLKDQLNHMILKLLNQRQLEQLKETWWSDNPLRKECPREENQSDGISIHNIGGVFIVIFIGILLACFTLLFEYWWYKTRDPPQEENLEPTIEQLAHGEAFQTNFKSEYSKFSEKPQVSEMPLPTIEDSW